MFKRILIANRGEIACRIIRTARRLGVQTVAVHSDADIDGLHVRMADEAVLIGPAPSSASYLNQGAILEAARATAAEAIHPGFGFLSENDDFARAVREAGLVFLGPPDAAIAAMGDKIESKAIAERAGVNTIPGYGGALRDAEEAAAVARDVGYPVMLKASAGGGGKGMRIARDADEVREGFSAAASEARSSFGDDRIFVEKFIERPRHIEIQILADAHGNVLHLGERECSIQRRHQKVIEESPSPFIDADTRAAMGAQAVALARAVGYESAGTVEFIVDAERNFYFLEMNTRLQVEHPVTELVYGLDLVEWMLRIGAGEALSFGQDDVRAGGWAMEARIYAEDPLRDFLPATGRLVRYRPPDEDDHVRVDSGVEEGGEISVFYDPMIAKLVTHGATRGEAIEHMTHALDAYTVRGVTNNIEFLSAVFHHPAFRAGELSTAFIEEHFPDGFRRYRGVTAEVETLVAIAALMQHTVDVRARAADGVPHPPPRLGAATAYVALVGETDLEEHPLTVAEQDAVREIRIANRPIRIETSWRPGHDRLDGLVNGRPMAAQVQRLGRRWMVTHAGHCITAKVLRPRAAELHRLMPVKRPPDLSRFLLSPMPGLLVRVSVEPGASVKVGQELAVVEAMKMENVLVAAQEATVARVLAGAGDSLAADQPILEFE